MNPNKDINPKSANDNQSKQGNFSSKDNQEITDWSDPIDVRDLDQIISHPDFFIPGC